MRNSDDLLNFLAGEGKKTETSEINFQENIYKAEDMKEIMLKGFINGKKRGETTCVKEIDPYFTWKKTFVHCWTGFPNHGKSEMFLQMALIKSIGSNWRWGLFVPENMSSEKTGEITAEEVFDTLAHAYVGKSTDPYYRNQMSQEEYLDAIDFLNKHFVIVYPKKDRNVDHVLQHFEYMVNNEGLDGVLIDPWNKLHHNFIREDNYLANQFDIIKGFAVENNVVFNIIAHPKGNQQKRQDGSLPVPDQYSLAGGAMWDNGMDVIMSVYRPNIHKDIQDTAVQLHSKKIRNQKLVGIPGVIDMSFDRASNRYLIDGVSPIAMLKSEKIETFEQKNNQWISSKSLKDAQTEFDLDMFDKKAPF